MIVEHLSTNIHVWNYHDLLKFYFYFNTRNIISFLDVEKYVARFELFLLI